MNVFAKGALLTAAVAVFGATSASAQNTDNDAIDVTAVVEAALDVTGAQDLDFGTLLPGFGRTIAPDDLGSGEFAITGADGAEIDLSFTLPATSALSNGTDDLPVTFTAGVGAARGATVALDPTAGGTTTLGLTGVSVFLGGTVSPAANQPAGAYTAPVTLTASYTGS